MRVGERARTGSRGDRLRDGVANPVPPGVECEAARVDVRVSQCDGGQETAGGAARQRAAVVILGRAVPAAAARHVAHLHPSARAARRTRQAAVDDGEGKYELARLVETTACVLEIALLRLRRERVHQATKQK